MPPSGPRAQYGVSSYGLHLCFLLANQFHSQTPLFTIHFSSLILLAYIELVHQHILNIDRLRRTSHTSPKMFSCRNLMVIKSTRMPCHGFWWAAAIVVRTQPAMVQSLLFVTYKDLWLLCVFPSDIKQLFHPHVILLGAAFIYLVTYYLPVDQGL
jgi:hypothetical protein